MYVKAAKLVVHIPYTSFRNATRPKPGQNLVDGQWSEEASDDIGYYVDVIRMKGQVMQALFDLKPTAKCGGVEIRRNKLKLLPEKEKAKNVT
jgi:hypothetical protein